MMGWNSALLLYSSCSSIVICILSVLYSYCGVSDSENDNGNINKESKTDVALINIDNSEDFLSAEPPIVKAGES